MAWQENIVYNKGMKVIALICFCIFLFCLVAVTSIAPQHSPLSTYELKRRRDKGNETAAQELQREALLGDVISLQKVAIAALLVTVVLFAVAAFGVILGVIVAVVVALFYNRAAQFSVIRTGADRFYDRIDTPLVRFVERHPMIGQTLRGVSFDTAPIAISSKEELEHLVKESNGILTTDEKKIILNGLSFGAKTVEATMTPRGVMDVVKANELIGPLMLDALHKTGHSRFPVTDGDIDHIIGVLHIRQLLTIDGKKNSQTARSAMEKKVYYINQDQTLEHALAAFLRTHHHLFVVVNGYRETAGILTLEDVLEALLGRKIVDEFDQHDDLRAVAERSAKLNNNSENTTNV